MAISVCTGLAESPPDISSYLLCCSLRPTRGRIRTGGFDIVSGRGVIDEDVGTEAGAGVAEGAGAGACAGTDAGAGEGVATMGTGVGIGT